MLRRLLILMCISALAFAKTPRPLANVPIHTPDLRTIDLKQYRNKKAIALMIFSTECRECAALVELMNKLQADFGPQGLQVVGAAGDDKARFLLGAFSARYRPTFPVGFLNKDEIIKVAEVPPGVRPVAPIMLFIDKWGYVREQYYGDSPIFRDAERSLRALCMAMIKIAPVAPVKSAPTH